MRNLGVREVGYSQSIVAHVVFGAFNVVVEWEVLVKVLVVGLHQHRVLIPQVPGPGPITIVGTDDLPHRPGRLA